MLVIGRSLLFDMGVIRFNFLTSFVRILPSLLLLNILSFPFIRFDVRRQSLPFPLLLCLDRVFRLDVALKVSGLDDEDVGGTVGRHAGGVAGGQQVLRRRLALEAVPAGAMEDDAAFVPADGFHVEFVARIDRAFAFRASSETADDFRDLAGGGGDVAPC